MNQYVLYDANNSDGMNLTAELTPLQAEEQNQAFVQSGTNRRWIPVNSQKAN